MSRSPLKWRRVHGSVVRSWIEVIGDFEALLSFAHTRMSTLMTLFRSLSTDPLPSQAPSWVTR